LKHSGLFISFEGIDGSGKSTQLQLCADTLEKKGYSILVTRNPGGTDFGQELRQILLHSTYAVDPVAELMLFMADRAQHRKDVILPALADGKIVLCDRYSDSTFAYQGYGRGIDLETIQQLNTIATQGLEPHLTLLFDGEPSVLAQRVSKRGANDRMEAESLNFRSRVREGYLALTKAKPHRVHLLDATQSIEALHQTVVETIEKRCAIQSLSTPTV
jgi:dTMP kinase